MTKKRLALLTTWFIILLSGCAQARYKPNCKQILKEMHSMSDTVIMDFGDYDVMLPPLTYCPGDEIRYVFAVPRDNMVGTNELDNAIKLLEFKSDSDLDQHVIKKNFIDMVTGPFEFRYLPSWSETEVAYSQSKGFIIANIPEKKVEIHTISPGMYTGEIGNVSVLDAPKRTFVIEINPHAAGMGNYEKILKTICFEKGILTVLAEQNIGIRTLSYTEPWFVYQNKIFIYHDSTTSIDVYDKVFKPSQHALAEAFNQNSKVFRCLKEIIVHPKLPFAIIVEMGKDPDISHLESLPPEEKIKALEPLYDEISRTTLYLFRWELKEEKQRFVPLLSVAGSIWKTYNPKNAYDNFCFSPDGKWLVFRDGSMRGNDLNSSINPVFVAVPISEKNPLYLGKPVKLGKVIREDATGPEGTAWTTNPTAFVMCDGMLIYRWNLDKYNQQGTTRVKMPPGSQDPLLK